jgi:hypothetical protein
LYRGSFGTHNGLPEVRDMYKSLHSYQHPKAVVARKSNIWEFCLLGLQWSSGLTVLASEMRDMKANTFSGITL